MALSEDLLKRLNRIYEPSAVINFHYRTNDIAVQTNEEGKAVRAFIGNLKEDGFIKGDRYSRTIIRDREGRIIKDYWERKGRAS